MWLASLSRHDRNGRIIATERWSPAELAVAQEYLDVLLDGIGDPTRERSFRMCITLCRHRALTVDEHDALPAAWHDEPAVDIAGGSVEVLWHRGIPDLPSTRPCENMGRVQIGGNPLHPLWAPVDCGSCEPCLAREAAAEGVCACRR